MFFMSLYLGFLGRLEKQLATRTAILLRGFHALVLFFVVATGSVFPLESGEAFSELSSLPSVIITERTQNSLPEQDESLFTRADSEHEIQRTRCRWQMDRVLTSSLGQKAVDEVPFEDCTEEEEWQVGVREENREIREKVLLLASDEYPISGMAGSISTYDSRIAGLIVGIAKKESNWGKRTPKLRGEECFNYWGYRGYGNRGMTEDGYGCFEKPADAVDAIGARLIELSQLRGTTDPERMIVWKCGSSCATHSPESVHKWISDVKLYYQQFAETS